MLDASSTPFYSRVKDENTFAGSFFKVISLSCGLFLAPVAIHGSPDMLLSDLPLEDAKLPLIDESRFKGIPPPGIPIREPDMEWVASQLASMTLDEKIGQMIVTEKHAIGESLIDNFKVGGFVFLGNSQNAADIVATVNRLQMYSPRPLWFSIDSEAGLGARVSDATIFPMLMAFGATDDPALIEQCGRITARESQALGIQVAYGPVVDVNTEYRNPIISTRSASDLPFLVQHMAHYFIKGARAEGVLCTFKHYPGHGATAGDSHSSLPGVDLTMAQLEEMHIKPYRDLAVSGDVDLVMTAHVWYSQVHPGTPWPATLSPIFNKEVLRDSIGFDGVLISDAFNMAGLTIAVPDEGERAVIGIENGLDVILVCDDVGVVQTAIKNAVNTNRLTVDRIEASVRRVLIVKSRAGLPERTTVDPTAYLNVLNHPTHRAAVRAVCERAFTCGKNELSTPPVDRAESVLVLSLSATQRIFYRFSRTYFTDPFGVEVPNATFRTVTTSAGSTERNQIIAQAVDFDKVIVLGYDWHSISSPGQVTLINALAQNKPVIYVSFGAPYHYQQIPGVQAFYCGYASVPDMQEVAVKVLLGDQRPTGFLPVEVDGLPRNLPDHGFVFQ